MGSRQGRPAVTASERLFRVLLYAYPRATRSASGDDMAQLFADRLRDVEAPTEKAQVWAEAIADIVVTAPRERLGNARAVALAQGPSSAHGHWPDVAVAAWAPLIAAVVMIWQPGPFVVLADNRVALLGLPAGVSVTAAAAILAAIGGFAARYSRALREPDVQLVLVAALLAPVPAIWFISTQSVADALIYSIAMTLFAFATRYRRLMLALIAPFVFWLILGPALILDVIVLGNS
jgi:hypothetical protein